MLVSYWPLAIIEAFALDSDSHTAVPRRPGRARDDSGQTSKKVFASRRAPAPELKSVPGQGVPACPICLDPTTTTLECGHAMCEPCMGNLAVSQGQTVTRSRRRVVIQCPLRCLAPTEWVLA